MINTKYMLTTPLNIEAVYEDIDYRGSNVLVRPMYLSICKADMRYYFGQRNVRILKSRLPLALIHEACGEVLYDASGHYRVGDTVVLLPNIPGKQRQYKENYRLDSRFRSSRADGFMQEIVSLPETEVLSYHGIPKEIATMTEFISVGMHAVQTYQKRLCRAPEQIAVWGDGALGYVICLLLRHYFPNVRLSVIGKNQNKLSMFQFVDRRYLIDELDRENIFDDVFECVGGMGSASAIGQMIGCIRPEGMITLMGVSEEPVPVNTRLVLEKGLTVIGRSRSEKENFAESIRLLENNPLICERMRMIISDIVCVNKLQDIHYAFAQAKLADYKVVLEWRL